MTFNGRLVSTWLMQAKDKAYAKGWDDAIKASFAAVYDGLISECYPDAVIEALNEVEVRIANLKKGN